MLMSFRRLLALGSLLVLALLLVLLHLSYPLPYIYTVMVHQDADFADIHRFPARPISPGETIVDLPVAIDPEVTRVLDEQVGDPGLQSLLEATQTSAFLVVRDDTLVVEKYGLGHDRESLQNSFSVSKSITSALIGLALRDGLMQHDAPITDYLPELLERDERFGAITIEHLLDMRSGIRYSAGVSFPFVTEDDPLIYYHPDIEAVLLERTEIATAPGPFRYNNYNPPLLGVALRRVTGVPVSTYLEREFWHPLGARYPAGWTVDDRGIERMESGFHARARDLARIGMAYLGNGSIRGSRVIPDRWIDVTTELAERPDLDRFDGRSWEYRGGWWIVPRPQGRSDFCAIGRYGQFIYVSPQYGVVIVRNGPDRGSWGDRDWTELFYAVAERI